MKNYMNFKNLTFIGLLFLAFQNYKTRNTLNELKAKIEYSHFELNEIKKTIFYYYKFSFIAENTIIGPLYQN